MAPLMGTLAICVLRMVAILAGACGSQGYTSSSSWLNPSIAHAHINGATTLSPSEAPALILPTHHSHTKGHIPVPIATSPDYAGPSIVAMPPLILHSHPPKMMTVPSPVPATMRSSRYRKHGKSTLHPPKLSVAPSSHQGKRFDHQGPNISPFPSHQVFPPSTSHMEASRHAHVPAPGPIHHPAASVSVISSPMETGVPVFSPKLFPFSPAPRSHTSRVLSRAPAPAPIARFAWALPPPPPNLDCSLLSCMEPLTYSLPGSPCLCVRPMKVGLRLAVELYTFFPLVSELAREISSGTSMKQSQVRVMGANAGTEQPEKTIVLIDLVPHGERFDNSTAFMIYGKFWKKQIGIKMMYFGDYDVLYVTYPGLPPQHSTSPGNFDANDGPLRNDSNSKTEHPLGVDVGSRKGKFGDSMIAVIILSSVIALVLCVGVTWLFLLKRSGQTCISSQSRTMLPHFTKVPGSRPTLHGSGRSSTSASLSSNAATYSAKVFNAVEMENATNNFDDLKIIGEGGFGRVYLGILEDGMQVAVKVLKREDQQGGREFLSEVEMLSRLHHRNLVKLIGICTEEHMRCLVYELIPNGSVESHLHGVDKEAAPLDWGARMKIALGSARGLAYLHEDSMPRVIHRDFKSSNILLEYDFTAKVSDFGLARTAVEEGKEHVSTRVMGTFGYVAPEYAMTGHLLVKSDVYSYGVVLLELLTGRKPVDMLRPPGQENLVTWARPLLTSKEGLEMLIDPSLGSDLPLDSVAKVAAIASMCIQSEVSNRPFMGEVVQALKLVCNEHDGSRASENCSREEFSTQDPEIKPLEGLASRTDRVLSASEIFSMPLGSTRNTSGSFRRHASSGPLKPTKNSFWRRVRGLSRREHSPG